MLSPEVQSIILEVLAVLTVAMPLLEKAVHSTATTADDKALDVLKTILSWVPRIRFGK